MRCQCSTDSILLWIDPLVVFWIWYCRWSCVPHTTVVVCLAKFRFGYLVMNCLWVILHWIEWINFIFIAELIVERGEDGGGGGGFVLGIENIVLFVRTLSLVHILWSLCGQSCACHAPTGPTSSISSLTLLEPVHRPHWPAVMVLTFMAK